MYLNAHSYYSFKYGTMSPAQLLEETRQSGVSTMALTDINSTAGCLEFVRESPKYGVRPALGVDFRNGVQQLFVAIARNNEGFFEINSYLSQFLRGAPAGFPGGSEDEATFNGNLQIPPRAPEEWENVSVIYPASAAKGCITKLRANEWIGIKPQDVNSFKIRAGDFPNNKLVALSTSTFRHKRDFNVHRLLRAIGENKLLSKLAESEVASEADRLLSPQELAAIYKDIPELLSGAERLIDQCCIDFDFSENRPPQNLKTYTGCEKHDIILLRKLCNDGLPYRYQKMTQAIKIRLEKELDIIQAQGFVSYFLINWDILRYARSKNYFYVGRGSGANSIVAYLLRITDVDPIELDLYFERFINLYRKNPPDFDIDFSWKDREDVTRYIFGRFPNTALLATYSTFQYKAAIRELGKVFGMPSLEIEQMSSVDTAVAGSADKLTQNIRSYGRLIQDFPSHLSIHAGGVLISEKPIHYFTATHLPPKGFATTQFDMVVAEDVGLFKFDILSQRGLGKIKDSLELIRKNNPGHPPIDIHDVNRFKKDEKIKELLREGKAIGCFYVESPAMRMLLKKLRVDDYLGLVAASSIIRPGVARSGMMREYILRFRFPEKRKEAHPVMLDIMPETFGVMVYQEDVIKVAHLFAGLDLAEADVLRRGMSGKFRSRDEFQLVKHKFFENCRKRGFDDKVTGEVWYQIESFAGYAFSKGHSASYAVESYQTLFLKAWYPLEYLVATLNNGGGFYRPELYVHEAKMLGATVEPPCVNRSLKLADIEGSKIRLGLEFVKGLESGTITRILADRAKNGNYQNLEDFINRAAVSLEQLMLLLRVGAFGFTGKSKQKLLWETHYMYQKMGLAKKSPARNHQCIPLFEAPSLRDFQLPGLTIDPLDNAHDEIDLLGFPLCNPFLLLGPKVASYVRASELKQLPGQEVNMLGYLVAVKDTRSLKGQRMNFGTFIDEEGSFIDTIHFPPVAAQYPFRGKGFYRLIGKVVEEFGFYSLEVTEMQKEALLDKVG